MRYKSTRGDVHGLNFEQTICSGFTKNGGLLMPEDLPELSLETLKAWSHLSYPEIVKKVAAIFISKDEIPRLDLNELIDKAFGKFSHPQIAPLVKLNNGLVIHELFHGSTLSFKDLSLSCLGQFLEYFLSKRQKHLTVLVATSGDTGSAAINAVKGLRWVDIVVLLPKDRCSQIQELMMTTVIEPNVHIFRVDGDSDELDCIMKPCFTNNEFCEQHSLGCMNSINWARIMVHIAHHIYAALQMSPDLDREVEIVVPSGGCGNVVGGYIAKRMGVPVKLVSAVNCNDSVKRVVQEGQFLHEKCKKTLAPAMDIQMPYNLERLWYLLTDGDADLINKMMMEIEKTGKLVLSQTLHNQMQKVVKVFKADDEDIVSTIRRCWSENGYLACPHTAVGLAYHYAQIDRLGTNKEQQVHVCNATASPSKFPEIAHQLGLSAHLSPPLGYLTSKPQKFVELSREDNWHHALQSMIKVITKRVKNV